MPETQVKPQSILVLRWTARAITIACLGFWLFFNVASFFQWYSSNGLPGAMIHLIMTAIIIALLLLTFLFELLAAIIFLWLAVSVFIQWGQDNIFVALMMALPLLIMGLMFIAVWWLDFKARRAESQPDPGQLETTD